MTNSNLTVGISLSGGGARGIAHIGVLQAFEEYNIFPGWISGTSMGAIVGVLYASGYNPKEIADMLHKEKIFKWFKVEWFNKGLLSLAGVRNVLSKYVEADDFETLKKPFSLAVSNLNSGKGEIISKGLNLKDWVVASASIPIIFKPVVINGSSYVDGGLFHNLPTEALLGECDLIVGSNVNPISRGFEVGSTRQIGERIFNLAIAQNVWQSRNYCDFFIEPKNIRKFSTWDYSKIDELIDVGYLAAKRVIKNMVLPEMSVNDVVEKA